MGSADQNEENITSFSKEKSFCMTVTIIDAFYRMSSHFFL